MNQQDKDEYLRFCDAVMRRETLDTIKEWEGKPSPLAKMPCRMEIFDTTYAMLLQAKIERDRLVQENARLLEWLNRVERTLDVMAAQVNAFYMAGPLLKLDEGDEP